MLFHRDLTNKFPKQDTNSAMCYVGVNIGLLDVYSNMNLDA